MDTGEYDTNTLLINNIQAIGFRFYEILPSPSLVASQVATTLSYVENAARNDGHLVFADYSKGGLWNFMLPTQASSLPVNLLGDGSVEIYDQPFIQREDGVVDPSTLVKSRVNGPNSANTPNSSSSNGSGLESSLRSAQSFGISPPGLPQGVPSDFDFRPFQFSGIDSRLSGTSPASDVYEYFFSALLSVLTSAFARRTGATPLNLRTVALPLNLLASEDSESTSPSCTIATFRTYITTTGSLVISLSVKYLEGLLPLAELSEMGIGIQRMPILVAPLGLFGSLSLRDAESPHDISLVQSPETQILRLRNQPEERIKHWRLAWLKVLENRGVAPSVLDHTSWVSVQSIRQRPLDQRIDGKRSPLPVVPSGMMWPAVLCFSKRPRSTVPSTVNRIDDTIRCGRSDNYDPLSSAKSWLASAEEREALLSQRKREREALAPLDSEELEGRNQGLTSYHPLMLRRTSNTRADPANVGTVYPTPPDAVQNPAAGVTPSFDGLVSSPTAAANTTTLIDLDVVPGQPTSKEDTTDLWDNQDKRSQAGSLFEGEPDNLFGDIGEDVYADADITDADFNFFDADPEAMFSELGGLDDFGSTDNDPQARGPSRRESQQSINAPAIVTAEKPDGVFVKPDGVFVKPELKYARSALDTGSGKRDLNTPNNRIVPVKRHPSPFNQLTVFKRVKASVEVGAPISPFGARNRRPRFGNEYERVEFDPFVDKVGRKYSGSGPFQCPQDAVEEIPQTDAQSRVTDYIRHRGRLKPRLKNPPFNTGSLAKAIGLVNGTVDAHPPRDDEPVSDADDSSDASDLDDSSSESVNLPSPVKSGVPTIRPPEDDGLSVETSFKEVDFPDELFPAPPSELTRVSRAASSGVVLEKYFLDPEPFPIQLSLNDDDFVTIAQILTEQAATGSLVYPSSIEDAPQTVGDRRRNLAVAARQSLQALQQEVRRLFGDSEECQLGSFIEVPDVPLIGQPTRSQSRPNAREDPMKHSHLFPIGPPHLELKRSGSKLSILPTAVSFWESLGLGPSLGQKHVSSACVFPEWEGMAYNADMFLDRLRIAYESLHLGSFSRVPLSKGNTDTTEESSTQDGILGFEVDKISTANDTVARVASSQSEKMARLARAMASSGSTGKNFVVFFVYVPDNARSIVEACMTFRVLFEQYRSQLRSRPVNELVLQLVPLHSIASPSAVVMPAPADFGRLALETYDRCVLFDGPMPAPSILLEKPLSKTIDFKLTTSPSGSLLHENSCIHISYAQSVDERWVSAAWTDTRGAQQLTASYCLGRKGMPLSSSLLDITREMWSTTYDIVSVYKVHWRVVVTKSGPMAPQEVACWQELAAAHRNSSSSSSSGSGGGGGSGGGPTTSLSLSLTLMTVDTSPSLQLIPPAVKVPTSAAAGFYTTPVSTPQPAGGASGGMRSPDLHAKDPSSSTADNTATDPDSKSSLIDVADLSWGAVLGHRLNTSASLTELSPSLVSGYLIKNGGARAEDPPLVMEVNIVHSEVNARLYEAQLKEMLGHFRALGSLARARGTTGGDDVRPWHVAATEKGVRALYLLM